MRNRKERLERSKSWEDEKTGGRKGWKSRDIGENVLWDLRLTCPSKFTFALGRFLTVTVRCIAPSWTDRFFAIGSFESIWTHDRGTIRFGYFIIIRQDSPPILEFSSLETRSCTVGWNGRGIYSSLFPFIVIIIQALIPSHLYGYICLFNMSWNQFFSSLFGTFLVPYLDKYENFFRSSLSFQVIISHLAQDTWGQFTPQEYLVLFVDHMSNISGPESQRTRGRNSISGLRVTEADIIGKRLDWFDSTENSVVDWLEKWGSLRRCGQSCGDWSNCTGYWFIAVLGAYSHWFVVTWSMPVPIRRWMMTSGIEAHLCRHHHDLTFSGWRSWLMG